MPKLHGSNSFLEWRIQTQSVDHCPLRKPLWMSHAGMLGTKCASEPAKANENWPWTQIPSEERWQTWQKGKIWHTLVFTGDQTALGKDTHTEKPLLQFETPPTEHVTLLLLTAGSYSLMSFLTANSLSNCFFFFFFFFISQPGLPASHLKPSKRLLLLLVSSSYICSEGVTAVRRKKDPAEDFSIELSEAGCFNKSCPMKGQGTFCEVASPMTLSFGAPRWTLSARTSFPKIKSTWQVFTG